MLGAFLHLNVSLTRVRPQLVSFLTSVMVVVKAAVAEMEDVLQRPRHHRVNALTAAQPPNPTPTDASLAIHPLTFAPVNVQ